MNQVQYAESHKYTMGGFLSLSLATLIHVALIFMLVGWLDMGWSGICIATSAQFFSRFVISQIYLCCIEPYQKTNYVSFFSASTTSSLRPQFDRGFMSMLMGVWGWWAFDIFTLLASYLSIAAISAQTIMRSLGLVTFMIPVGFNRAMSYYVGYYIGQGCEKSLKHYYNVALLMACFVGILQMILLWALRDQFINMYTTQADIQEQMRLCWNIFIIFVFFDTTQGIC